MSPLTAHQWPGLDAMPADGAASVVTLGVFDGVHRGHQQVLAEAVALGAQAGQAPVVLTFDPHPDGVVRPGTAPRLLSTLQRRRELLTGLGAGAVGVVPFTPEFARLTAAEFARQVLAGQLRARTVVVGEDFRFGQRAAGDLALLAELGREHGFTARGVPLLTAADGEPVSASAIRTLLTTGDVVGAARALGRPHLLEGTAVRGARRRAAGSVPLLRLEPAADAAVPADGAYAGWLVALDAGGAQTGRWPATVWLGAGPPPDGWKKAIRIHLLDDAEPDLDGRRVGVEFVSRVGGQAPPDAMVHLVPRHVAAARTVLQPQHDPAVSREGRERLRPALLLAKLSPAGAGAVAETPAAADGNGSSGPAPGAASRIRTRVRPDHVRGAGTLGDAVVSGDDSHLMTIAPTGAGKGRDVIIPNLLSYEGSVVVFDPKGENYDVTHRYRREVLGHQIVLLDPFGSSYTGGGERDCLNPFDVQAHIARQRGESLEESAGDFGRLLAEILGGGVKSLSDPFWDEMAQLLIAGLSSDMITHKSDHLRNLPELRRRLFSRNVRSYISGALAEREGEMGPGTAQEFKMLISIGAAETTFAGIVATAAQQLAPFSSRSSVEAISATSFDLTALTDPAKRISLYIVLPPHKLRTHQRLLRAWIGSLLYLVMNTQGTGTQLLFMIDEAAQLGRFSLLEEAITLLRGYGMRTWTFWQDLAQIEALYGVSAETMINNSGVLQVFGATNFRSAAALAARLGCEPGDMLEMDTGDQMIAFRSEWPTRLRRFNYLTDSQLARRSDPNPRFT